MTHQRSALMRLIARCAIPACVVVAGAACADQAPSAVNSLEPPIGIPTGAEPLQMRPLLVGQYSGIPDARRVVIRDAAAWQAFWQEAAGIIQPVPATPAVDFSHEMVIAASLGQRPTGGYDIAIDAVFQSGGQLFAVVRETSPPPGAIVTQAISAPVAAVAVPRADAPVMFVPASANP